MLAHLKSKKHFYIIAIKPYKFVVSTMCRSLFLFFFKLILNLAFYLILFVCVLLCHLVCLPLFSFVSVCLFVVCFLLSPCSFVLFVCSFVFFCSFTLFFFVPLFFLFFCFDDIVWWCRLRVLQTGWFTNSICSICGKFRFYSNIKRPKSHSLNQQLPPLETFRLFSYFVFRLSGVVLNFLLMSY